MSLESFKSFVKTRPSLASFVQNGTSSWQKFYELYELYGENSSVWNKYLYPNTSSVTLKDVFGMIQNIDVSEVQNSIISMQKGIKYIESIVKSKEEEILPKKNVYEARPLYKYFDD